MSIKLDMAGVSGGARELVITKYTKFNLLFFLYAIFLFTSQL